MPILIIGFSDATRKFHPLSIIITRNESFEVFKSAIIKLKEWCDIDNVKMTIRTMTTDMGRQFKAFENFPFVKLDCWYHTKNLIRIDIKSKSLESEILKEIDFMQLMPNEDMFDRAYSLFRQKYDDIDSLTDFIDGFDLKRICQHPNWFEDADIFAPSTNNALECFYMHLKYDRLKSRIVSIIEFIDVCYCLFKEEENKAVATKPNYDLKFEESNFSLIGQKNIETNNTVQYIFKKDIKLNPGQNVTLFPGINIRGLEDFDKSKNLKEMIENYWKYSIVLFKKNPVSYFDVSCTCREFAKNKACLHSYKVLTDNSCLHLVNLPIHSNKKRGRPKTETNKTNSSYFLEKQKRN